MLKIIHATDHVFHHLEYNNTVLNLQGGPYTEMYNRFSSRNDTEKYKNEVYKDSKICTMDDLEIIQN